MQKENHQTYQELLDIGSELTLNPGDPKHHGALTVKVGSYGGQLIDGASAQVLLTHKRPSGSPNPSCAYFPSSRMHDCNRHNQQLAQSPHGLPDLWSQGGYGRKGRLEATRTAITQENSKLKGINTTIQEALQSQDHH